MKGYLLLIAGFFLSAGCLPAQFSQTFLPVAGGEPQDLLYRLTKERRHLEDQGFSGSELREQLSAVESGGLDILKEAYLRQYVDREVSWKREDIESLFASEEELIRQRIEWERSRDEDYGRERAGLLQDHEELLSQRDLWKERSGVLRAEADRLWRHRFAEAENFWVNEEQELLYWNEVHRGPYIEALGAVLDLQKRSEELLFSAELHLYRGEAAEYWNSVRGEYGAYVHRSQDRFRSLVKEELEKIASPAAELYEQAVLVEAQARRRRQRLEEIGEFFAQDPEERKTYDELLYDLAERTEEFRRLPYSDEQTGRAAVEEEMERLRGILLRLQSKEPFEEDLRSEYTAAVDAHEKAEKELSRLQKVLEEEAPGSYGAKVPEELALAFEREDLYKERLGGIEKAPGLLEAKREKNRDDYHRFQEKADDKLYDLFLVSLDSPEQWMREVESRGTSASGLLRDFALAYGHEVGGLDPGYASKNGVYKSLKNKVENSGADHLKAAQRAAYSRVYGDEKKLELYTFYRSYLQERGEEIEGSLLHRAAIEDLGAELFEGIDDAADKKYDFFKSMQKSYNIQSAGYAAAAAALYATLNFPAAAAMTGAAAAAKVSANEMRSKAGDIAELRAGLRRMGMSGADEREEFLLGLGEYRAAKEEKHRLEAEYRLISEEKRSWTEWAEEWESGEGAFDFASDFFAQKERRLDDILAGDPALDPETVLRADEFLSSLTLPALRASVSAETERKGLWKKHYADAAWNEKALLLSHALIHTESGKTEDYARALFELRAERARVRLREKRERAAGFLHEGRSAWEHRARRVLGRAEEVWKEAVKSSEKLAVKWDRSFKTRYNEGEKTWKRRIVRYRESLAEREREKMRRRLQAYAAGLASSRAPMAGEYGKLPSLAEVNFEGSGPLSAAEEGHGLSVFTSAKEILSSQSTAFTRYSSSVRSAYERYLGDLPELRSRLEETMQRSELQLMVDGLRELLDRESAYLDSAIRKANETVERSVNTSFRSLGYRREQGGYKRKAIVDISLRDYEYERQWVAAYRYYEEPDFLWESRLDSLLREHGSFEEARTEYTGALEEISGRRSLVFGGYGEDLSTVLKAVGTEASDRFTAARKSFWTASGDSKRELLDAGAGDGLRRKSAGLFAFHIGFAPEMDEDDRQRMVKKGYGEMGRIYTKLYRQEARQARGLAMMEIPSWDRKLWDDDADNDGESDGYFSAPTTRQVVNVGMSVAASLLAPGVGQILANMGDDIFFSSADVNSGRISLDEAGIRLGISASLSALSTANGAVWGLQPQAATDWSTKALMEEAGRRTGSAVSAALLRSGFSGLDYSSSGGFVYDENEFFEELSSGRTIVSVADGFVGTIGRNAFHNAFLKDSRTHGFSTEDTIGIRDVGELGIDLASAAAAYGIDGELTLNVLSASSVGLMELRLGRGFELEGFSLGSSGYDLSAARLSRVFEGMRTMSLQGRIASLLDGAEEGVTQSALRFQYSFGDETAAETLRKILSGRDRLLISQGEDYLGLTAADGEGGRILRLSLPGLPADALENAGLLQAQLLALVLQHEAHRDGINGGAEDSPGWSDELSSAVRAHAEMAVGIGRDQRYSRDFYRYIPSLFVDMAALKRGSAGDASSLVSLYDDSADFWRLSKDGYLMWDGSHHLWDESGRLLAVHDKGSFSRDVADYIGVSRQEALGMMDRAGLRWSEKKGTYVQHPSQERIPAGAELMAKYELMEKYGSVLGDSLVYTPRSAYAWEMREREYARIFGEPVSADASSGKTELFQNYQTFLLASGLKGRDGFSGIEHRIDLDHYSQQRLETETAGTVLDAANGDGYCLAQSIAFAYMDAHPDVDWQDVSRVFREADWQGHFDIESGYVGDKAAFTGILADELGVSAVVTERRYGSEEELAAALQGIISQTGNLPSYRVIADYGSHFTQVRPDGTEINSYSGWDRAGREPEAWRLMTW